MARIIMKYRKKNEKQYGENGINGNGVIVINNGEISWRVSGMAAKITGIISNSDSSGVYQKTSA